MNLINFFIQKYFIDLGDTKEYIKLSILGPFNSNYFINTNKVYTDINTPYLNTYCPIPFNTSCSPLFSFVNAGFYPTPPMSSNIFKISNCSKATPNIGNDSKALGNSKAAASTGTKGSNRSKKVLSETSMYYKEQFTPLIEKISKEVGVDAEFIKCIIQQESKFIPHAVSPCGAVGLMQIMPCHYKNLGITNPCDPEQNIRGGAVLIRWLLKCYNGDKKLALSAYNKGKGRVDELINKHGKSFEAICQYLPNETKDYVPAIMNSYPC